MHILFCWFIPVDGQTVASKRQSQAAPAHSRVLLCGCADGPRRRLQAHMCQSLAAAPPFPHLLTTQYFSDRVSILCYLTCKHLRPCRTQNSRCGASAPYGARQRSHGGETVLKGSGCRCSSPAAEASASTSGDVIAVKRELLAAIEGTDRGIGGVQVLRPHLLLLAPCTRDCVCHAVIVTT